MIIPEIFRSYQHEIFVRFCGAPENFSQNILGDERSEIWNGFRKKYGLKQLGINILDPVQTHSKRVFSESEFFGEGGSGCDGVYTDKKNILCAIKTADCIGAIFYSPELKIGGAVHAGWRGLEKRIFTEFLQKFSRAQRENFLVALSPSLGKCCAEFSDPYHETPDFFHPYIETRTEKLKTQYFLDLWEIGKQELLENGVLEKNIQMPDFCTQCQKNSKGETVSEEQFWSHRNGDIQRNGSFFMKY